MIFLSIMEYSCLSFEPVSKCSELQISYEDYFFAKILLTILQLFRTIDPFSRRFEQKSPTIEMSFVFFPPRRRRIVQAVRGLNCLGYPLISGAILRLRSTEEHLHVQKTLCKSRFACIPI